MPARDALHWRIQCRITHGIAILQLMLTGDWILWLAAMLVLGLFASLVYIAWRALFYDRANGRRRCPRCWYDMAYSPGMTCAECGFTARSEAQFGKTRRRYLLAGFAIGGCVAMALAVNLRVMDRGWISMVPSRMLILSLPLTEGDSAAFRELNRRMALQTLNTSEVTMLIRRCARGDLWARPPGSETEHAWIAKYGRGIERWRGSLVRRGEVTGYDRREIDPSSSEYNDIERLLIDIPPIVDLSLPDQWPPDMPPRLQINLRHWWPLGTEVRIHIEPEYVDRVITVHQSEDGARGAFGVVLEPLHMDVDEVSFDITVQRRRAGIEESWQPALQTTMTVPVRIDEQLTYDAQGVDDDASRQMIREVFEGVVVSWPSGRSPVRFRYDPNPSLRPTFEGMSIGVAMQLYRGDELARQLNIWWLAGSDQANRGRRAAMRGLGWEIAYTDRELLAEIDDDDDRWVMRVEGRREIAALAGEAERYWNGSYTVPMTLIGSNRPAPTPEWWFSEEDNRLLVPETSHEGP